MLALRSLVAVCALAMVGQQALAANDSGGYVASDGVQSGPAPYTTTAPAGRAMRNPVMNANASCSRPQLTPEQKAQRQAARRNQQANMRTHAPKSPEQKAQAAARRAARCGNVQPM